MIRSESLLKYQPLVGDTYSYLSKYLRKKISNIARFFCAQISMWSRQTCALYELYVFSADWRQYDQALGNSTLWRLPNCEKQNRQCLYVMIEEMHRYRANLPLDNSMSPWYLHEVNSGRSWSTHTRATGWFQFKLSLFLSSWKPAAG